MKLKPIIAERAKERQGTRTDICQKSDKGSKVDTKKELAAIAGVSHDTIHKVETIENNTDADPDVRGELHEKETDPERT